MAKVASVLAALYLAMAPGMNVAALLHAVELCEMFEPKPVVASHGCPHDHDPAPKPDPEDCPHTHDLGVERGVMPLAPVQAATDAAPRWQLCLPLAIAASPMQAEFVQPVERPPPDVPRVGVTQILV